MLSDARQLRGSYRLTRLLFLRFLGPIYFVAFLVLAQQLRPLIGADGLLPVHTFLYGADATAGAHLSDFVALPTLFWLNDSDAFMVALAWVGTGLSLLVLFGCANALLLATLWFLYLSFYHVGQLFWGYGWELLLLETGFLAIFLCPLLDWRQQPAPPRTIIWLLRWVLFRVMFGAGLIKLRGDPCWRDFTCMFYHYETQPLPNPLSWYLHQLPPLVHEFEVLFNHFVELIVPWTLVAPRRLRHLGGVFLVAFQVLLILSGNLSWLNWLTITLCIACFDDQALLRVVPRRFVSWDLAPAERVQTVIAGGVAVLVIYLSVGPVMNLLGSRQIMNGSFDRLHLVNTYGAFGSIGKRRAEVILEGTTDDTITAATRWRPYEFKCKPGDVYRRPCVVAPYQYRIDWQIWFAAMSSIQREPWLQHFVAKLLEGDTAALRLLAANPFPAGPPRFVRAELYEYRFTRWGDPSGAWWTRKRLGPYLPPVSLESSGLRSLLESHGWRRAR